MTEAIHDYFEKLFQNAPMTPEITELKEEMRQNTIDHYQDLLNDGQSPETAYRNAIAKIGSIDELLKTFCHPAENPEDLKTETVFTPAREERKRVSHFSFSLFISLGLLFLLGSPAFLIYLRSWAGGALMVASIALGISFMTFGATH